MAQFLSLRCSNGFVAGRGLESLLCQTAAGSAGNGFLEFSVRFIFATASQQKLSQEFVTRLVNRGRTEGDRELVLQAHRLEH
jgi:hypothetical protein